MSVVALIILIGGILLLLLPVWLLKVLTDRMWPGLVWILFLVFIIGSYVSIITGKVRESPPPNPVDEIIETAGVDDPLVVERVRIDLPKDSRAEIAVDLINRSSEEIDIELSYYADGGTVGAFSPGASGVGWVSSVTPEWAGSLTHDCQVPGFVAGGKIKISVMVLEELEVLALDEGDEIFSKEYVVVPVE